MCIRDRDELVILQGRASFREGEDGKLVVQNVQLLQKRQEVDKLYLKQAADTPEFVMEAVRGALHGSPGGVPVYLFEAATDVYKRQAQSTTYESPDKSLQNLHFLEKKECPYYLHGM